MMIFASLDDVKRADLPTRLDRLVRRCVEATIKAGDYPEAGHSYDPGQDGFVVLLQRGDDTRPLDEIKLDKSLADLVFEGVEVDPESRAFVGYFLANNQFGLTIIQPDATWLDPRVRACLAKQAGDGKQGEEGA